MIYTLETMRLWPRLIHAARAVDVTLAPVLEDLMQKGASLAFDASGYFRLGPGAMSQGAYAHVAKEQFDHRQRALQGVQVKARSDLHPWMQSVMDAYRAAAKNCELGRDYLWEAAQKNDRAEFKKYGPALASRYLQAAMLAQTLWYAGAVQAAKDVDQHLLDAGALIQGLYNLDTAFPSEGFEYQHEHKAIGITTEDGRLWLVDRTDREPPGRKPDEPMLTDKELGTVMAPVGAVVHSWSDGEAA